MRDVILAGETMDETAIQSVMTEAMALIREQKFAEAESVLLRAGERIAEDGVICRTLAAVIAAQAKLTDALPWHERAVALMPDDPAAHFNHGKTLAGLKRFELAEKSFARTLELSPNSVPAMQELGACEATLGKHGLAVHHLQRALEANEANDPAHALISDSHRELGNYAQAIAHIRRAVELDPTDPQHRRVYGLNLLQQGEWADGWRQADARWQMPEFVAIRERMPAAAWDGSTLDGKTIYLQPEQGLGDVIQFVRFAELVAQRGGRVLVGCDPRLQKLVATVPGVSEAVVVGDQVPACDCWFPLMSLPTVFGTTPSSVPAKVPYVYVNAPLSPPPVLRGRAREGARGERDAAEPPPQASPGVPGEGVLRKVLRVGIAWAGNPENPRDRYRSARLEELKALFAVAGVEWVSLQVGPPAAEATKFGLLDLAAELKTLEDTAAVIKNLDLVLAVDTAVLHLAGALGAKTWALLSFSSDWRWMIGREDSPWYPTMRLFRQRKVGDWDELARRVATELSTQVSQA